MWPLTGSCAACGRKISEGGRKSFEHGPGERLRCATNLNTFGAEQERGDISVKPPECPATRVSLIV